MRDILVIPGIPVQKKYGMFHMENAAEGEFSDLIREFGIDSQDNIKEHVAKHGRDYLFESKTGQRFRASFRPTVQGYSVALRLIADEPRSLEKLNFNIEIVEDLLKLKEGLFLIAGPTGNGKTTTASGFVKSYLTKHGGSCGTVEDPAEYRLHGQHGKGVCEQTEAPYSKFGEEIISLLRHAAPELVFLGELREEGGILEGIRGALNGHLVVATIHASDIQEVLSKALAYMDHNRANKMLAEALTAILVQSLEKHGDMVRPKYSFLNVRGQNGEAGIRNNIRKDSIEMLSTVIEQQTRGRGY